VNPSREAVAALSVGLAAAIFVVDLLLPLGLGVGAFYPIVVAVSLLSGSARVTHYVAAICVVLLAAGGLLSPESLVPAWIAWFNRAVVAVAVWITATIAVRLLRARTVLQEQQHQLERANRDLAALARHDSLTGVGNRRSFDEQLALECDRVGRSGAPLSLLMIDVDRFKRYNDAAGHPAGDACLAAVASAVRSTLRRPIDFVARYGGDEFAVILPATGEQGAHERAMQIRRAVGVLAIPFSDSSVADFVTVSVGIATHSGPTHPDVLLKAADDSLYQAKRADRDTVASTRVDPAT